MGIWKRVSEKTKQAMGLKANVTDWKPTSNARNQAMIEEASRFSKQLKALHRELREMESRIESDLIVLKTVLSSPLPRVYEANDKGAVPVDKSTTMVGQGVAFEVLTTTATDLKSKLQQEVLHPLDQWQAAYRMIKQRNNKCDQLRLELDAKRREAAAMQVQLDKQKTRANHSDTDKAAEAATRTSSGNKFEDAEFKLQKEADKVQRLEQRFRDIEDEVYNALLTLINDTKVLKQYAASALLVFQGAFVQAHTAFGTDPGVLPISAAPPPPASTPVKSPQSSVSQSSPVASKTGPDTPDPPQPAPASTPQAPPAAPAPPAWYTEAQRDPKSMKDDSDDD